MIFIFAVLLFILTWIGIGSAFFLLVYVSSSLFRGILHAICKWFWPETDRCPNVLLYCHLVALFPICFTGCYMVFMTLEVFVPIMGKTGQSLDPELFIAALIALAAIITTLCTSSLIVISRKLGYFIKITALVTIVFLVLLLTTDLGVPYKWDPEAPRLRRVHIGHLSRRIYAPDGTEEMKDNGLWVASLDYRGSEDLLTHTFLQGSKVPDCGNDTYCNIPYYLPVERMLLPKASRWVSVPSAPKFPKSIEVKMVGKNVLSRQRLNFTFEVEGPDHLTMFLTPFGPWAIESWSLTERAVFPPGTRFIYAAYGRYSGPWKFWVTLRPNDVVSADVSKKQLKFGVGSHILHGDSMKSDTLEQIVELIKERRSDSGDLATGWWKWAITPQAWNSEFVSQYY